LRHEFGAPSGNLDMTEAQRIPPQFADTPEQPAETNPAEIKTTSGPAPQTLSDIERAALEMVGRKPPKRTSEPVVTYISVPADEVPPQASQPASEPAPWVEIKTPEETKLTAETMSADHVDPIEIDPTARTAQAEQVKPAAADINLVEQFDPAAILHPEAPIQAAPAPAKIATPAVRPMFDDHFHLALTKFQSASLAIAIFGFVIAAFGMAASGWATAHDWTCRVAPASSYCPAPPAIPKSPALPEIPS
jgi:hypothetical protein